METQARVIESTILKSFQRDQGSLAEERLDILPVEGGSASTSPVELDSIKSIATSSLKIHGKAFRALQKPEFINVESQVVEWLSIIQSWEGRIVSVDEANNEFTAIISDRSDRSNPDEEVVIDLDAVRKGDHSLVEEGAVFYWNVGKQRVNQNGTVQNASDIRMRRLPGLSKAQIDMAKAMGQRIAARLHAD